MSEKSRFHMPAAYAQFGPVLVDTNRDPFKGIMLDHPANGESRKMAKILQVVEEMQNRFHAITMVLPTHAEIQLDELKSNRLIQARARKKPFFLTDDGGHLLYEVRHNNKRVRMHGLYSEETKAHVEKNETMAGDLLQKEVEVLPRFLGNMEGGLTLGTAAGMGKEHSVLASAMHEQQGVYICHDTVPSLPRLAAQEEWMRDIPYAVLPPYEDFLAPILKAHAGPKAIVARNLLSVCLLDSMEELVKTARAGGADRVILSQTTAFTPNVAFVPVEHQPGKESWIALFDKKLDKVLESGEISTADIEANPRLFPNQAAITFWAHCWELVREVLRSAGDKNGYELRTYQWEHQSDVPRQDASNCVDFHPELLAAFNENKFNTSVFSPLHESYGHDPNLPTGTFRKKLLQWIFLLKRPGRQNEYSGLVEASVVAPDASLAPPEMRGLDGRLAWFYGAEHDPDFRLRRCIARLTHEIFFDQITSMNTGLSDGDLKKLAERLLNDYCSLRPPSH